MHRIPTHTHLHLLQAPAGVCLEYGSCAHILHSHPCEHMGEHRLPHLPAQTLITNSHECESESLGKLLSQCTCQLASDYKLRHIRVPTCFFCLFVFFLRCRACTCSHSFCFSFLFFSCTAHAPTATVSSLRPSALLLSAHVLPVVPNIPSRIRTTSSAVVSVCTRARSFL